MAEHERRLLREFDDPRHRERFAAAGDARAAFGRGRPGRGRPPAPRSPRAGPRPARRERPTGISAWLDGNTHRGTVGRAGARRELLRAPTGNSSPVTFVSARRSGAHAAWGARSLGRSAFQTARHHAPIPRKPIMIQPPLLFSGTSNRELADEIAKKMQTRIGNALVDRFKNDECRIEIRENVRGAEVFVLQSLCRTPVGRLGQRRGDGTLADDRRAAPRIRPPHHRRHPVLRLREARQEDERPRADLGQAAGQHAARRRARNASSPSTFTRRRSRASSTSRSTT